uniref:Uncharacterized protein n=1 Tax=Oryza sativa subsp. japonica TaxID=39947 RepID=Q6YVL4_ORYSJ|nr:hypothetical protein [Oryza sativa Japonica Group]
MEELDAGRLQLVVAAEVVASGSRRTHLQMGALSSAGWGDQGGAAAWLLCSIHRRGCRSRPPPSLPTWSKLPRPGNDRSVRPKAWWQRIPLTQGLALADPALHQCRRSSRKLSSVIVVVVAVDAACPLPPHPP